MKGPWAIPTIARRAADTAHPTATGRTALDTAITALEDGKAERITAIDLTGRCPMADAMVVASGTSARHVGALGDAVMRALKAAGVPGVRAQGLARGDWALVDSGDVVVHIMRPEVRDFYAIEDLWSE